MTKSYYSLGLMSGTSGDGVDASLIISDGNEKFELILNEYDEYSKDVFEEFHELKQKIFNYEDFIKYSKKINELERKITLRNSSAVKKIKDKLLQQKKKY